MSGLHLHDEVPQVNTFTYAMGEEAEDVMVSLKLAAEQQTDHSVVKDAFKKHFIPCRNIIFERAKFNRRNQECDATVEEFVTNLHKLVDPCEHGELKELI